jgi:AcrR family transcriptional regulator
MAARPESLTSTSERNRDVRSFVRTKERLLPYAPAVYRRRQLIDAAMRVTSREGAAKATTRRIVAEAGASLATLHYSFEDKQELFEAVVNDDALAARVDDRALSDLARDLLAVADGLVLQILALGPNGPSDDDIDRCAAMLLARFDRLEPGYPRA